jgi:polyhydroxyalkanoate synthesis regulator phasin
MNLQEAMRLAESWTRDMQPTRDYTHIPLFDAMRTLLDHVRQQNKDIEELTQACRVLFRRNKELENELQRSEKTS